MSRAASSPSIRSVIRARSTARPSRSSGQRPVSTTESSVTFGRISAMAAVFRPADSSTRTRATVATLRSS
jgi:hypothetical protein